MTYSETEPYPTLWLRSLIAAGHIVRGEVLGDIRYLKGGSLSGDKQFHAFAGIGAWSYALRLAGWPDDVPVWTGSCPCQPFSIAGKRKGEEDDRHLWPEWRRLIDECRPSAIFGEQIASPDGRAWLDNVSLDLEALGYAVGSADLCAAGVGAPHARQRLFFVAYSHNKRFDRIDSLLRPEDHGQERKKTIPETARHGAASSMAHPFGFKPPIWGVSANGGAKAQPERRGATGGFWRDAEWIECTDRKARPVEPGSFPLAYGSPSRVGKLRAFGNCIVPQVAVEFIRASIEAMRP